MDQAGQVWLSLFLALIGGGVSLVSLVITQQMKVSDFRLKWIEDFRNELGIFLGNIENLLKLVTPYIKKEHKDDEKTVFTADEYRLKDDALRTFRHKYRQLYTPLDQNKNSILLRLYSEEEDKEDKLFKRLKESINELNLWFFEKDCTIVNCSIVTDKVNAVRDISEKIFQKQWKRVRIGERTFKITKYIVVFLIAVVIALMLWLFLFNRLFTIRHMRSEWIVTRSIYAPPPARMAVAASVPHLNSLLGKRPFA